LRRRRRFGPHHRRAQAPHCLEWSARVFHDPSETAGGSRRWGRNRPSSGLVGVGGGMFLSPLILLAGWADPRTSCGVAAPIVPVNSLAGILGTLQASLLCRPSFRSGRLPWLQAA
jgi:hypothetical protein